jgi:hypothetical protein
MKMTLVKKSGGPGRLSARGVPQRKRFGSVRQLRSSFDKTELGTFHLIQKRMTPSSRWRAVSWLADEN